MGLEKGGVYAALPLPCEGREIVFDKLPAQVKHNKIKNEKDDIIMKQSR